MEAYRKLTLDEKPGNVTRFLAAYGDDDELHCRCVWYMLLMGTSLEVAWLYGMLCTDDSPRLDVFRCIYGTCINTR